MPIGLKIMIALAILAAVYGILCLVADHLRKRDNAQRELEREQAAKQLVRDVHTAHVNGNTVAFNHGGSDIEVAVIRTADNGVFYYVTPKGSRRASYDMVSDFRVVDVENNVASQLLAQLA